MCARKEQYPLFDLYKAFDKFESSHKSDIFYPERPNVCSRSSDPFYVVTYYIKWVTTSWTYSRTSNNVRIKIILFDNFASNG